MIDMRRLRELVKLMGENDLAELDLRDQQETVTIKRNIPGGQPVVISQPLSQGMGAMPPAAAAPTHAAGEAAAPSSSGSSDDADAAASDEGLVAIESPMVGTFYSAENPDSPPFVSAGTNVSASTVVCIIEAMKVFNEIKAELSAPSNACSSKTVMRLSLAKNSSSCALTNSVTVRSSFRLRFRLNFHFDFHFGRSLPCAPKPAFAHDLNPTFHLPPFAVSKTTERVPKHVQTSHDRQPRRDRAPHHPRMPRPGH